MGSLEVAAQGSSMSCIGGLGRQGSLNGIREEWEESGESCRYSNDYSTILKQIREEEKEVQEEVVTEESEVED